MAKKKKFSRGINALFSDEDEESVDIQTSLQKEIEPEVKVKKVKKPAETKKVSLNLSYEIYEKIKAYSFSKRVPYALIITKSIESYLSNIPNDDIEDALELLRSSDTEL